MVRCPSLLRALFFALLLTGCGGFQSHSVDVRLLKEANKIDAEAAQLVALESLLAAGAHPQTLERMQLDSVEVEDIGGHPFFHLVALKAKSSKSLWQQLTEGDVLAVSSDSATFAVGASEVRERISFEESGLETLESIQETIRTLQKSSRAMKRLVAFSPLLIFIEDFHGKLWSLRTQTPLSEAEVQTLKDNYIQMAERNQQQEELTAQKKESWEGVLEAQDYLKTEARALEDSGNLNIQRSLASLSVEAPNLLDDGAGETEALFDRTTHQKCTYFLWIKLGCSDYKAVGGLPSHQKQVSGGYVQNYTDLHRDYTHLNIPTLSLCSLPFNSRPSDGRYSLGCGPSAFASMMWWWQKYKGIRWYSQPYNGEAPIYSSETHTRRNGSQGKVAKTSFWYKLYSDRVQGKPRIMHDMKSCWYRTGTATTYSNLVAGGTKFLNHQTSAYRAPRFAVRSAGFTFSNQLPFFNHTQSMARRIRESGRKNLIAIVSYPVPGASIGAYHYSPVLDYDVTYLTTRATIRVRPVDTPHRMITITDAWALTGAVVYIERI